MCALPVWMRRLRTTIGRGPQYREMAEHALGDQPSLPWLEDLARDVHYGLRWLRRSPAFTAVALLTLGLAIAANTAMFSVVNAVLLRPLPYRSPQQLVTLWSGSPSTNDQRRPAYRTVEEWRQHSTSFAAMAVLDPVSVTLTDTNGAEKISAARVSPDFFPLVGVPLLFGRTFSEEEAAERRHLAVLGYRFWKTRFGGSPAVIGASIVLDGVPSEIIGILPGGFDTPVVNVDVWEPHTLFPDWEARRRVRGAGSWFVFARLRPRVTVDQAQAEMSGIARVLDSDLPISDRSGGVSVVPLSMYMVGPRSRLALWMLTGAVFCVLLIAAANVASLSLARSVGRTREIAIRAAMGAGSARIIRQLVAEGVTIAAISGVLGTALAVEGIRLIRVFGPADLARVNEVSLDLRVLGWALVVSTFTGILVGLAPALTTLRRGSRLAGSEAGYRVSAGAVSRKIRRILVVAEITMAITLLGAAGLLIRSWRHAAQVDPGFRPERILSIQLSTPAAMPAAQRATFYAAVLEQVEALPGVERAGMIGDLFVNSDAEPIVTVEGSAGTAFERVRLRIDEASNKLFETIGAPLIQGRAFSAEDRPDSPRVAIINEAMARRVWHGRDPVGSRFQLGAVTSERAWFTVVGVVGDMRRQGLETEPIPQVFESLTQNPSRLETLLVRTSMSDPLKMAGAVQAAVRRVEKDAPLYAVTSLEDRLGAYLTQRRFQTSLLTAFSVVALLMAVIGIYGLIHYSVAIRTQEIGIRIAIGARPGDIFRIIFQEGLRLTAIGLILGIAGALLAGRAAASLLFGVTATDPLTFLTVSLLLTVAAAAACYFPARRAMKVDPIVVLRQGGH